MEFKTPKTPKELNDLFVAIRETAYNENSTMGVEFRGQSGEQMKESWDMEDELKQKVLNDLNHSRADGNKALSFYGPWIACEDGSIDYGPNEFYYLSAGWHKDKWILPHVLRKPWRLGTTLDLLRAMRDAAKAIGVENLNVNLSKIY